MSWIGEYALSFLAVLGTVVLLHEFGHYLVAKWFGVTVEVFSIGFGPRLWGFRRGGTDYRLSWIPLGGYVKLRGESPEEEGGGPPGPGDLTGRPRWQRFLVFVMGAVFNLITAFVLTAYIFVEGVQEPAFLYGPPVIGDVEPDSPAVAAGLQAGDFVHSVGGTPVVTWKDLQLQILLNPRQTKDLVVERDGERRTVRLAIATGQGDIGRAGLFPRTGVMVGDLQPGMPADRAGLRRGDRIVSIDDAPIDVLQKVFTVIQAAAGRPLRFAIDREGRTFETTITPVEEEGRGRIGFVPVPPTVVRAYPLPEAMVQSLRSNLESAGLVFITFEKLIKRELSLRAFSGPVDLFRFSGQAAQEGFVPLLQFIAFVSLQLGIINLLPVPPLDGGHIFTILVEGTMRRDLPARLKERVSQAGLVLLLLFMGTIIYFDITKNFFRP